MTAPAVASAQLCTRLRALADPVRWRTVELLSTGERCVCDLESATGVAQSRLSYHLSILRDAGLIIPRKEGRWTYYALAPAALEEVGAAAAGLAEVWQKQGRFVQGRRCD